MPLLAPWSRDPAAHCRNGSTLEPSGTARAFGKQTAVPVLNAARQGFALLEGLKPLMQREHAHPRGGGSHRNAAPGEALDAHHADMERRGEQCRQCRIVDQHQCWKCRGSGTFVWKGGAGTCFRCLGKGWLSQCDTIRGEVYDLNRAREW